MAISQLNDPSQDESLNPSPGRCLREARIAEKLEIEEVAARLHLDVRVVKSIEADDHDQLPPPTFVRGYLHCYARLVGLPCAAIVEAYDRNEFEPPPLVPDIANPEQAKSTDFPVRLTTYAIAGILVVMVAIWWQSQQLSPFGNGENTESVEVPEVSDQSEPVTPTPESEETSSIATVVAETDPAEVESVVLDIATLVEPDIAPTAKLDDELPQPQVIEPSEAGDSEATSASLETSTVSSAIAFSSDPTLDELRIEFMHESWVEIYNRHEQMMFFDLAKQGATIEITDSAPFRILLGYAVDAKVAFNGQPFDLGPHTNTRGIARFTVEEDVPAIAESRFLPQSSQQH